jgi:hypothetical protein
MVLYLISFFHLPKGVLHRLNYFQSRFFEQGDSEKRSIGWQNEMRFANQKIKGD